MKADADSDCAMTRLEYLLKQYANLFEWYQVAESKATFLVTINTVVAGGLTALVFNENAKLKSLLPEYRVPVLCALALTGAALLVSYGFVLRAMWARHHYLDTRPPDSERLWFFGDVASMSQAAHEKAVEAWSEPHMEATMRVQNYILSRNLWTKHEALNRAITLSILAFVLLFALGATYEWGALGSDSPP